MIKQRIKVPWQSLHPDAQVPCRFHVEDAGYDVHCVEHEIVRRGHITPVRTGIALEIPIGYQAEVRPRSGLAKKGLFIVNSPGTIDSTYRGEVKVLMTLLPLLGRDTMVHHFEPGYRIAQLVFGPVTDAEFFPVIELTPTTRGPDGFGSTGK